MSEDAARAEWADDYEFLRNRARAHLSAVADPTAGAPGTPHIAPPSPTATATLERPIAPLRSSEQRRFGPASDSVDRPPALREPSPRRPSPRERPRRAPHPLDAALHDATSLERPRRAATTDSMRRPRAPRAYGSRLDDPTYRPGPPEGGRRTVVIAGQPTRPRPNRTRDLQRFAFQPDRTALWAFVLALFLVLMAVATAHA